MIQLLRLLFIAGISAALPQIGLPVNAQVPPLAHPDEPFEFQFSPSTFQTLDTDTISYSLQDSPRWLDLNGSTRTLCGTPSAEDMGAATFSLVASDQEGSLPMQVTFLVSDSRPPEMTMNISEQLSQAGPLSDVASVQLKPRSQFHIAFGSGVFKATQDLSLYATMGDRSPLPSWINFDPGAVSFSGVTPDLEDYGRQYFRLLLMASTVPGFDGASINFGLVVSSHELAFDPLTRQVSVEDGELFELQGLKDHLFLDGRNIPPQQIASAEADVPPWLHFDSSTLQINGTCPKNFEGLTLQIKVDDVFGDNARTIIRFSPSLTSANGTQSSISRPLASSTADCSLISNGARANRQHDNGGTSGSTLRKLIAIPSVIGGLAILGLLFCFCKRFPLVGRGKQDSTEHGLPQTTEKGGLGLYSWSDQCPTVPKTPKALHLETTSRPQSASSAPQLNISIHDLHRISDMSGLQPQEDRTTRNHKGSSSLCRSLASLSDFASPLPALARRFDYPLRQSHPRFSRFYASAPPTRRSSGRGHGGIGYGAPQPQSVFYESASILSALNTMQSQSWRTVGSSEVSQSENSRWPYPLSDQAKKDSIRFVTPEQSSTSGEGPSRPKRNSTERDSFRTSQSRSLGLRRTSPFFGSRNPSQPMSRRSATLSNRQRTSQAVYPPEGFPRPVQRGPSTVSGEERASDNGDGDGRSNFSFEADDSTGAGALEGRQSVEADESSRREGRSENEAAGAPSESTHRSLMGELIHQLRQSNTRDSVSGGESDGNEDEATNGHGAFL